MTFYTRSRWHIRLGKPFPQAGDTIKPPILRFAFRWLRRIVAIEIAHQCKVVTPLYKHKDNDFTQRYDFDSDNPVWGHRFSLSCVLSLTERGTRHQNPSYLKHVRPLLYSNGLRSKTRFEGYSVFLFYESSMCTTEIKYPRVPFSSASMTKPWTVTRLKPVEYRGICWGLFCGPTHATFFRGVLPLPWGVSLSVRSWRKGKREMRGKGKRKRGEKEKKWKAHCL